ncbi:hypothetical protein [Xanthomonas oryzae]|nr:hypothetical protein [Xanthomonas oryzae]ALS93924.1 hypothetical protein AXO1947_04590 [Xanthomonas oryzae pv. oryzae]AUI91517.1 hypothetical protein BVV16_17375 [Xanthomonas oryzae pv. oryzae]AUI95191.1 hypothetical protein BVV17_17400 [Xanthomonas oryzae pv. oryzae]AUI98863.1 hypothetical protein BVV18_17395 [Xanthomonas oryzae pv. oryzae]AUJ02542.1 hypothetical protein BVV10_17405 [Xanthomonas oryzae pv. oryzae]
MNRSCRKPRIFSALGLCMIAGAGWAAGLPPQVAQLQDRWAVITYQLPKPQRVVALEALAQQSDQVRHALPDDADALIWDGIVRSSLAGEKGGLGALAQVKRARSDFEEAIKRAPRALDGAAYTSLGALYYQVPGWPIGFGDDAKARTLLYQGLAIDPDGLDSNYFVGDFLRDQKDWAGAEKAFAKAAAAAPRPGRQIADAGRRKELAAKLTDVRAQLAKQ